MAVQPNIRYLNRDFNSIRSQLINYSQTYFPNTYTDFSDSSPGIMFMEQAAYVSDVLSFYLDNQIQETYLQYARQFSNLYDLAYILAILGGIILVIVILINFISILSRIIFLNPLVGDFELVEIGSAIAISSFLPLCHLKKGNVIVDFITAKLNFKKKRICFF